MRWTLSKCFHLSELHIPEQQKSTGWKFPVTSGPREAGLGSIRLSPCEMPSPNHRPPFPGPRGSKGWCRVEKHLWPEQRAEGADTVPGGGGEGKVSRPIPPRREDTCTFWGWVAFLGREWAVCKGEGKKFISWWIESVIFVAVHNIFYFKLYNCFLSPFVMVQFSELR